MDVDVVAPHRLVESCLGMRLIQPLGLDKNDVPSEVLNKFGGPVEQLGHNLRIENLHSDPQIDLDSRRFPRSAHPDMAGPVGALPLLAKRKSGLCIAEGRALIRPPSPAPRGG